MQEAKQSSEQSQHLQQEKQLLQEQVSSKCADSVLRTLQRDNWPLAVLLPLDTFIAIRLLIRKFSTTIIEAEACN